MRLMTIALAATVFTALPAAANDTLYETLKLEVNAWETVGNALYYVAVSDPGQRETALENYQDDAGDVARYIDGLATRLEASQREQLLDPVASDWLALKELADALIADVDAGSSGAIVDEDIRAMWKQRDVLEGSIDTLIEAIRN
ncbi:hypothetical protein [Bauldia sp.]|uniref:hypothetical protein n=1 Tax=Bauldia sp. TaxID=2575872 RepID=UPI003BAB54E4